MRVRKCVSEKVRERMGDRDEKRESVREWEWERASGSGSERW